MLFGKYVNSIDVKGRCIIPAKFRHELGDSCMLMKGLDRCLYLYTKEEWLKYVDAYVENKSDENETAHDLKLFFYGNSAECDIDRQGRINLPQDYVAYADIQKEMVNVGFGSRIEIWSKETYDSKMSSDEMNPRKLLGRIHTNANQP